MENGESRGAKDTARTEAFSDGVFAFAITLLVLNLRDPSFLSPGVSSGIPVFEGLVREWQSFSPWWRPSFQSLSCGANTPTRFGTSTDADGRAVRVIGILFLSYVLPPSR